jgi:hypothetical protein
MTIKIFLYIITIEFLILSTASSNEEIPIFNGDTLRIPAVDSLEKSGEFQDVIFKFNEQGEWLLLDYKVGKEIHVQEIENVELIKTETFPIQVFLKISGNFTSGCQKVGKIKHKQIENNFNVVIYYDNDEKFSSGEFTCTAGFVPFTRVIPLPVYSLKEGEYQYTVNSDFTGIFNLGSDNELGF